MDYTCRDYAFNCTAGIRRHVEHLVELKAERTLIVFVRSGGMLYRMVPHSSVLMVIFKWLDIGIIFMWMSEV